MAVCTFFGHHDCPSSIRPALVTTLIDLIEHSGVDTFSLAITAHLMLWHDLCYPN